MVAADYIIIGLIVVFALLGLKNGLLKSIYKVVALVASIYLSIKLARPVAGWFRGTGLYLKLKELVSDIIAKLGIDFTQIADTSDANSIYDVIKGTPFPDNVKTSISEALAKSSQNAAGLLDEFVDKIAFFLLVILCAIILFIILRILFWLAGYLIKGITSLPIIKQVDRVAGFILGAAMGVVIVYLISLLLIYTSPYEKLAPIYENINRGLIAPYFYNNNFLADFFGFIKEGWL
ncbi:MAG TPA: CvpA family protein [Clostridia bacterium]|nr:CvpA family protein [Clostridia bacterium]HPQ46731.1 CvpA family protein [Clostridia bacterium]HRX42772.1 CvpA family protein [Clostridia bacterium]